ncbi:MAG: Stp1/IreP family PP2C-type Ser/Thr phosphatase [Bacillota bacterium]|nr:Stp1/IreP family PP2C-type Ser/Thr phosphatase [Bacillota bacterium]
MKAWSLTDIGLKRIENEDFYFCDAEKGLFLIADGMGGHAGGEVASATAVKVVRDHFFGVTEENYRKEISGIFRLANQEIYQLAQRKKHLKGMGTTLAAAAVSGEHLFIGYVGDSRVYLYRNGDIRQLTEDQNIAGQLVRSGELTEEEAMEHPGKNLLTNAMGLHPDLEIAFCHEILEKDDILLMCTDGLNSFLSSSELAQIIHKYEKDLSKALDKMLKTALERGGDDNITIILTKNSWYEVKS